MEYVLDVGRVVIIGAVIGVVIGWFLGNAIDGALVGAALLGFPTALYSLLKSRRVKRSQDEYDSFLTAVKQNDEREVVKSLRSKPHFLYGIYYIKDTGTSTEIRHTTTTPLEEAIKAGNISMVEMLYAKRKDISTDKRWKELEKTWGLKTLDREIRESLSNSALSVSQREAAAKVLGESQVEVEHLSAKSSQALLSQTKTDEYVRVLVQLCQAYAANSKQEIQRLEPECLQIGRSLNELGGIEAMKAVFNKIPQQQGKRTLDMLWNGIGDWRG